MTFEKLPVTSIAIKRRRPFYSIGINNANYLTQRRVNGKGIRCPIYRTWANMLRRCYSSNPNSTDISYVNCFVCKDWLIFSNFAKWMEQQDWQGKHLDKDILVKNNKEYGPTTCLFVTQKINNFLETNEGNRGILPMGVNFHKQSGKFSARMRKDGKQTSLGYFVTAKQASIVYRVAKRAHIRKTASQQTEPLKSALLRHVRFF